MLSRRALAWSALAASLVTILLASTPFWLARAVDGTPLEFSGASRVVTAGTWAFLLSSVAALALGAGALALPKAACGPRDLRTILLAAVAMLPAAAALLLILALVSSNLDF